MEKKINSGSKKEKWKKGNLMVVYYMGKQWIKFVL